MLPGMKHLIEICSSNRIGQTIVRPARFGSVITRFIGNIDPFVVEADTVMSFL
jgi:hypothetical protein